MFIPNNRLLLLFFCFLLENTENAYSNDTLLLLCLNTMPQVIPRGAAERQVKRRTSGDEDDGSEVFCYS